jgi:hypothetical protein
MICYVQIDENLRGTGHGRDRMVVGFTTTSARSPLRLWIPSPAHDEMYSIQHYVIKFFIDLRQVGGFLWVLQFLNQ